MENQEKIQLDQENIQLGIALDEKINFNISIDNQTFFQKVFRIKEKTYQVSKYTNLAKNIQITKLIIELSAFDYGDKPKKDSLEDSLKLIASGLEIIESHTDRFVDIISILLNERNKKFLKMNLSNKDISDIIMQFFGMIDLQSFATATTLIRNKVGLMNNK